MLADTRPLGFVVEERVSSSGCHEVASDGSMFTCGSANFYGSMGGHPINAPVVGMATT